MPTCSGTQYHLQEPISEMNPNLPIITKLMEYLSTLLSNVEQKLKSNKERETAENASENRPHPENRASKNGVQTDNDEINLKH